MTPRRRIWFRKFFYTFIVSAPSMTALGVRLVLGLFRWHTSNPFNACDTLQPASFTHAKTWMTRLLG